MTAPPKPFGVPMLPVDTRRIDARTDDVRHALDELHATTRDELSELLREIKRLRDALAEQPASHAALVAELAGVRQAYAARWQDCQALTEKLDAAIAERDRLAARLAEIHRHCPLMLGDDVEVDLPGGFKRTRVHVLRYVGFESVINQALHRWDNEGKTWRRVASTEPPPAAPPVQPEPEADESSVILAGLARLNQPAPVAAEAQERTSITADDVRHIGVLDEVPRAG